MTDDKAERADGAETAHTAELEDVQYEWSADGDRFALRLLLRLVNGEAAYLRLSSDDLVRLLDAAAAVRKQGTAGRSN